MEVIVRRLREGVEDKILNKDESTDVRVRDQITVDENGRGILRFGDRLVVELFRGTGIQLDQARVEQSGFVFVNVKQSFGHTETELKSIAEARVNIETDHATITALTSGTKFLTCHGSALTCTVTLEGETEVEAQDEVIVVKAGQATYICPGQPPQPLISAHEDEVQDWLNRKRGTEPIEPLGALVATWQGTTSPCSSDSTAPPTVHLPPGEGMVEVEQGSYMLGTPKPDDNHTAQHDIEVTGFWIDQHEVTNIQYSVFLQETGSEPPTGWSDKEFSTSKGQHPVKGVSWDQADAFCKWANKRLPTEAEWEIAARGPGPEPPPYPWGHDPLAGGQIDELPRTDTYEVGTKAFNMSRFGVYDMAGNVWEWVGEPYDPVTDGYKVLRGGRHGLLRDMAYRQLAEPNGKRFVPVAGFRCAADQVAGE
jgi:formylglycine-generating enzyme required for sulfatase activity